MKLATCRGVRPDWNRNGIIFNMEQLGQEGSNSLGISRYERCFAGTMR